MVLLFTLLFVVLEARFFYLQIVRGEDFRERARISVISEVRIPPRRGGIKDRNGKVLAANEPVYRLALTPHFLKDQTEPVVERLASLLQWTREFQADVISRVADGIAHKRRWEPIVVPGTLDADRCPVDGAVLELSTSPETVHFCRSDGRSVHPIDPKATQCPVDRGRLKWTDRS
ncbi:MAG: hypothetical protein QF464_18640, partial [Myxococcota bacterium]|nr:hypothetical protein [Myxococcota bacterium]